MPNVLKIIYGKHATQMYGYCFSYLGLCSFIMIFLLMTPLGVDYIWFWLMAGGMSVCALGLLLTVFSQDKFVGKPVSSFSEATGAWN